MIVEHVGAISDESPYTATACPTIFQLPSHQTNISAHEMQLISSDSIEQMILFEWFINTYNWSIEYENRII